MANVFDIFNKKSVRNIEVSENEQMNRYSPMTSVAGDSLQPQGVNNDSPFQNKDGAKASGNYTYGVESRQDSQEPVSPFTIPKLKRSKQDLFVEMATDSREWQQEVLPTLTKYFRFPSSSAKFEFLRVSMVQNAERTQKYLEKRKELRQQGYSERDIADSFAFLFVEDDRQTERICREGLGIGNLASSTIGHPRMGVQLCRYMDTVCSTNFVSGSTGKLIVFKIMKGRVKVVPENRTGPPLEPTPNFDSHMPKSSLDITPSSHQQLFELYQVYLYEYGEDLTVEPYPRQVLPFAVISFRYKEAPPSPRMPESPPVFSPRLMSPPIPKFTLSAPKEEIDPEYVIWCGHLRVKDIVDCQVKMVSTASQHKPAHLGTVLNVRDTCEMKTAEERYFKELSCLRKSGEVYWKGWYINVAELRPRPDSKAQFQNLMNHLGRTNSMAVLKPENDVILLLVPNCSLTHDLGLTRPHHYPVMFHCIFISKQSAKFKSPRYLQKVLLHQSSGGTLPSRLDSGQLSPITINVSTPSRPSMDPESPLTLLSPSSSLTTGASTLDRSASFGTLPRDEVTVWTDVLSAGRSERSHSFSQSSPSAEGNIPPGQAHNLMRLHRSISTEWTNSESPGKSIPLGYDEGFLSAVPLSARIDPVRLKSAFEIQHQIQDALSPVDPLQCDLPGNEFPTPMSPSVFDKKQDNVEQDDTITSSTSHDPTNLPSSSRQRSTSMEATFSPVPSPEKPPSEPEGIEVDDLRLPRSPVARPSFLSVPKESQPRARSLYLPPPNIPEYKPTPLYEPSPKRPKVEEVGKQSISVPLLDTGSIRGGTSSGASTSLYRTSVPKVGLTHVRSPRDLPLPISPADSSTDKVKSPTVSGNIATANDMKNFLNANLERKPPVKSPSTTPRSCPASSAHSSFSEVLLPCVSDSCALSHHCSKPFVTTATNQSKDCAAFTTADEVDSQISCPTHVPSFIVSIPFSHLCHQPSAWQSKQHLPWPVKRLHTKSSNHTARRAKGRQCSSVSKASVIVHIHPSTLLRPPRPSARFLSMVARKGRKPTIDICTSQATHVDGQTLSQFPHNGYCCELLRNDSLKKKKQYTHASADFHMFSIGNSQVHCDSVHSSHSDSNTVSQLHHHSTKSMSFHEEDSHSTDENLFHLPYSHHHPDSSTNSFIPKESKSLEHDQCLQANVQSAADLQHQPELLLNPSVPVDAVELNKRLKAVARERMVTDVVTRLKNCNVECGEKVSAALTSVADKVEQELQLRGLYCRPVVVKTKPEEEIVDLSLELLSQQDKCFPKDESVPSLKSHKLPQSQAVNTRSPADLVCKSFKRVPPVILKRTAGSTENKFRVLTQAHKLPEPWWHENSRPKNNLKRKSKLKMKKKQCGNFALSAKKLTALKSMSFRTELSNVDKVGIFELKKHDERNTKSFPDSLMWQNSGFSVTAARQVVMMLTNTTSFDTHLTSELSLVPVIDSGDICVGETSDSSSNVQRTDNSLKDNGQGESEMCVILEQIDELLHDGNTNSHYGVHKPLQEPKDKEYMVQAMPSTAESNLGDAEVYTMPVDEKPVTVFSDTIKNEKVERLPLKSNGKKDIQSQPLSVINARISDRETNPCGERKTFTEASCNTHIITKPVCGVYRFNQNSSKDILSKSQDKALQHFQICCPQLLKTCSVLLTDLKTTGLQLDSHGSCQTKSVRNKCIVASSLFCVQSHTKEKNGSVSKSRLGETNSDSQPVSCEEKKKRKKHSEPSEVRKKRKKHSEPSEVRKKRLSFSVENESPFDKLDSSVFTTSQSKQGESNTTTERTFSESSSQKCKGSLTKQNLKGTMKSLSMTSKPQSHSWSAVLHEMALLSSSSCANESSAELTRHCLPKIPKRNKTANDDLPSSKPTNLNTPVRADNFSNKPIKNAHQSKAMEDETQPSKPMNTHHLSKTTENETQASKPAKIDPSSYTQKQSELERSHSAQDSLPSQNDQRTVSANRPISNSTDVHLADRSASSCSTYDPTVPSVREPKSIFVLKREPVQLLQYHTNSVSNTKPVCSMPLSQVSAQNQSMQHFFQKPTSHKITCCAQNTTTTISEAHSLTQEATTWMTSVNPFPAPVPEATIPGLPKEQSQSLITCKEYNMEMPLLASTPPPLMSRHIQGLAETLGVESRTKIVQQYDAEFKAKCSKSQHSCSLDFEAAMSKACTNHAIFDSANISQKGTVSSPVVKIESTEKAVESEVFQNPHDLGAHIMFDQRSTKITQQKSYDSETHTGHAQKHGEVKTLKDFAVGKLQLKKSKYSEKASLELHGCRQEWTHSAAEPRSAASSHVMSESPIMQGKAKTEIKQKNMPKNHQLSGTVTWQSANIKEEPSIDLCRSDCWEDNSSSVKNSSFQLHGLQIQKLGTEQGEHLNFYGNDAADLILSSEDFTIVSCENLVCAEIPSSTCKMQINEDLKQRKECTPQAEGSTSDIPQTTVKQEDRRSNQCAENLTGKKPQKKSRPYIASNFCSFLASTLVKNKEENMKLDLELKRRQMKQASTLQPKLPEGKSESRTRSHSQSPQRLSESSKKSHSPRNQRSKSPSFSATSSRASNSSRENDGQRNERQHPARGRNREQVAEDRHGRQYRPYEDRPTRDQHRDSRKKERSWGRQKPIADFELAYKELNELLSDKTSRGFEKKLSEGVKRILPRYKDKRYKEGRFAGYQFRRSRIPSVEECRMLLKFEGQPTGYKPVSNMSDVPSEEDQDDMNARSCLAEALDQVLGENKNPHQDARRTHQGQTDDQQAQFRKPALAVKQVKEEVQEWPRPMSSKHFHSNAFPVITSATESLKPSGGDTRVVIHDPVESTSDGSSSAKFENGQRHFTSNTLSEPKVDQASFHYNAKCSGVTSNSCRFDKGGCKESPAKQPQPTNGGSVKQNSSDCKQTVKGPHTPPNPCPQKLPFFHSPETLPQLENRASGQNSTSCTPHEASLRSSKVDQLCLEHHDQIKAEPFYVWCKPPPRDPRLAAQQHSGFDGASTKSGPSPDSIHTMKVGEHHGSFVFQEPRSAELVFPSEVRKSPITPGPCPRQPVLCSLSTGNYIQTGDRSKKVEPLQEWEGTKHEFHGKLQPTITEKKLNSMQKTTVSDQNSAVKLHQSLSESARNCTFSSQSTCKNSNDTGFNAGLPHSRNQTTVTTLPSDQLVPSEEHQATKSVDNQASNKHAPAKEPSDQNMEKLVMHLRRLLEAQETSHVSDPPPPELLGHVSVPAPAPAHHKHRIRRKLAVNKTPWVLRYWPGRPVLITSVNRNPDYKPNPLLAKEGEVVEVIRYMPDPRLDLDLPPFVPAGKSQQAKAKLQKERKRFLSGIKVVKDIPLEPAYLQGRNQPKDPRHPFRSTVAELDDNAEKEEIQEEGKSATAFTSEIDLHLENRKSRKKELRHQRFMDTWPCETETVSFAVDGASHETCFRNEPNIPDIMVKLEKEKRHFIPTTCTTIRGCHSSSDVFDVTDTGCQSSSEVFDTTGTISESRRERSSCLERGLVIESNLTEKKHEARGKVKDDSYSVIIDMDISGENDSDNEHHSKYSEREGSKPDLKTSDDTLTEQSIVYKLSSPPSSHSSQVDSMLYWQREALNQELLSDVMEFNLFS